MGFMDKAKKLAEQAQQKLDEAQTQFNQNQSGAPAGGGVRYDEHGRPIQQDPPSGADTPLPAQPTAPTPDPAAPDSAVAPDAPTPDPAVPPPARAVDDHEEEPPPPPPSPSAGTNTSPDPFKPLQ